MNKRIIGLLAVLIVCVCINIAYAATYTITTTAAQETRLTRIRQRLAIQASPSPAPYANNDELVLAACKQGFSYLDNQQDLTDISTFDQALVGATMVQKQNACTALGKTLLPDGCK